MQEEKILKMDADRSDEKQGETGLSETWSQDAQDELENFIEEQGIYIRQ